MCFDVDRFDALLLVANPDHAYAQACSGDVPIVGAVPVRNEETVLVVCRNRHDDDVEVFLIRLGVLICLATWKSKGAVPKEPGLAAYPAQRNVSFPYPPLLGGGIVFRLLSCSCSVVLPQAGQYVVFGYSKRNAI